ncbi:hypothetical protein EDD86DRAFT_189858 [Gorgonomyces haynaldii]|nr:hypothetical protein EDD86DRAFT_189858 [Gorgonomyces haynaldii]
MERRQYDISSWGKHALHPKPSKQAVDFIFVMDLLNFSFWHERSLKKRFTVDFKGQHTGYWSLVASMQRGLSLGYRIDDPQYYSEMSEQDFDKIFATASPEHEEIPMRSKRIQMLHTAGKILVRDWNSSFTNVVTKANGSAKQLMHLVLQSFGELFDDSLEYQGEKLQFQKRLQILVADLWGCFQGTDYGYFSDIDSITMFADYRVPQALLAIGLISYSPELEQRLKEDELYHSTIGEPNENQKHMIPRGHQFEIEIRSASIYSVDLLVKEMCKKKKVNAIMADFYLWDLAKEQNTSMSHLPIHLTRSIYY